MSVLNLISGLFKPAAELVDNLTTSKEEKLELRNRLVQIENEFAGKLLDYESKLMEAKSSIIKSEATGHSWMQRNWRPITMLTFLALVICDSFGILTNRLAPEAWTLLKIGLGGYVIGRSAEKITPAITEAIKKKK